MQIKAEMLCTIMVIYIEDGQEVKSGQPLMETEVMKMTQTIESPCDGVLHLKVRVNDFVEEGDLLAEIEQRS